MRTVAVVIAFLGVSAPRVVLAQVPAPPPTRVCEIGLYACPTHADILATWPARCPMCQTVLSRVQPSAFTLVSLGPLIDMEGRRREEDEKAREAQRNKELREQARRNAELWGRYPNYGYYPPGGYPYTYPPPGYAYQYPYNYYYNPNTGQYEYVYPGYAYPYGAYSYNPNTGQYSYNPNAGQYYYNPNTGQYQYVKPGYAYPNRRNEEPRERERR